MEPGEQTERASAANDLFATETMAELCARQGRFGDAIAIYRRLLDGAVAADKRVRWEARVDELGRAPLVAAARPVAAAPSPMGLASARRLGGPLQATPATQRVPATIVVAPPPPPLIEELRLPLLITQPVRSGQVVYAVKTDLIVLGPVNPGAQLIADGNIHVYGPLRGRAVAGATGCREARIFCRHLEAELVGIDTAYLAREHLPPARIGQPAQIRFVSDPGGERCVLADLP